MKVGLVLWSRGPKQDCCAAKQLFYFKPEGNEKENVNSWQSSDLGSHLLLIFSCEQQFFQPTIAL